MIGNAVAADSKASDASNASVASGGHVAPRPAGRPRRGSVVIDATRIGEATLDVLSTEGISGLTISRIAKALDVRSQTLYYHVANVSDAVNMARGVLMDRIDSSLVEREPWDEAVANFGVAYYRAFRYLGQENSAFFMFEITNGQVLRAYESFVQAAMAAGVEGQSALQLLLDIEHTAFSTIFEHSSWSSLFSPEAIAREGCGLLESLLKTREHSQAAVERKVYESTLRLARAALG